MCNKIMTQIPFLHFGNTLVIHSSTLYPTSGSGMFFCRDRGTLSAVSSHLFEVLASASLVAPMRPSLPQRKLSRPPVGIKCSGLGILRLGLVDHG